MSAIQLCRAAGIRGPAAARAGPPAGSASVALWKEGAPRQALHCALQSFAASWGGSLVKAKHTAAVEEIDDAPVTVSTMRGVTSEAAFLDLPANKLPKGAREQSGDRVPRMRMRRGNKEAPAKPSPLARQGGRGRMRVGPCTPGPRCCHGEEAGVCGRQQNLLGTASTAVVTVLKSVPTAGKRGGNRCTESEGKHPEAPRLPAMAHQTLRGPQENDGRRGTALRPAQFPHRSPAKAAQVSVRQQRSLPRRTQVSHPLVGKAELLEAAAGLGRAVALCDDVLQWAARALLWGPQETLLNILLQYRRERPSGGAAYPHKMLHSP